MRAMGRPRSVTMTSSPALTASRYSLSLAFNDAIDARLTNFPPRPARILTGPLDQNSHEQITCLVHNPSGCRGSVAAKRGLAASPGRRGGGRGPARPPGGGNPHGRVGGGGGKGGGCPAGRGDGGA